MEKDFFQKFPNHRFWAAKIELSKEESMKRRSPLFVLFIFILLSPLFFSGVLLAAPPDNYTATMVTEGMSMPIAKMGNKMRSENPMIQGLITITLMDSRKMFMVSPSTQTYLEKPMEKHQIFSPDDPRMVVKKRKVGMEKIQGYSCTKYEATFQSKDHPSEQYQATLWEAKELGGLVIRTEMKPPKFMGATGKDKIISELKDIQIGAAKASMFEIPKGYRRVNSMMEMMGAPGNMGDFLKQFQKP